MANVATQVIDACRAGDRQACAGIGAATEAHSFLKEPQGAPPWLLMEIIGVVFAICGLCSAAQAVRPAVQSATLKNGVRVRYLHLPNSQNVSIFSFMPMGLAGDEAGRAQWSHLVEHLAVRSTMPGPLSEANAETQADCMRLDFYGSVENWRQGLAHHAKWLAGVPFTEQVLQVEKLAANLEADNVAQKRMPYKFAMAAWSQAQRHGRESVAVKGDIAAAKLKEVQAYRDHYLFVPHRTVVCGIGGVDPKTFLAAVEESIGGLTSQAKDLPMVQGKPGDRRATWDLDVSHVMMTWAIPGPEKAADHAALMVAGRLAMILANQDPELRQKAGQVLAGTDLRSPEEWHFWIAATPDSKSAVPELQQGLARAIRSLETITNEQLPVGLIARGLAEELEPLDPQTLLAQMPNQASSQMAEAQVALLWGMQEFRYGVHRAALMRSLRATTLNDVRRAVKTYLNAGQCSSLVLLPEGN